MDQKCICPLCGKSGKIVKKLVHLRIDQELWRGVINESEEKKVRIINIVESALENRKR